MNKRKFFRMAVTVILCIMSVALSNSGLRGTEEGLDDFEKKLVEEINKIRTDPTSYIPLLEQVKSSFQGNAIVYKGNIYIQTREGTAVIDEAIAYLRTVKAAKALQASPCLIASAEDHHNGQKTAGLVGHKGSDGSSPAKRIVQRCGPKKKTGESLTYGIYADETPQSVVMQLVVDDGVKDRIHRIRLFEQAYKFIGVSCGHHSKYQTMCVINTSGD